MARKAHSTRQKMTFKLAPSRPRNPVALPARMRAAGAHRKSASALRAEAARKLERALDEDKED